MKTNKTGRIVWHDLFTSNRREVMQFYKDVAGWHYQIEHAQDFVWGGGEKDFILASSGDVAGAGVIETPAGYERGWIAYVEVPDVDATVERVNALGGRTVREPFEVPGVGRNALVRDPCGALLGLSLSRHNFPVSSSQFGPERYINNGSDFPHTFYSELFGWQVNAKNDTGRIILLGPLGEPALIEHTAICSASSNTAWVPSIKVASIPDACRTADAKGAFAFSAELDRTIQPHSYILRDPNGVLFALE